MKLVNEKRQIQQFKANLFYFGLMTLVTTVIWIGTTVFRSFAKLTVDDQMQILIRELDPSIDLDFVSQYKETRLAAPDRFVIISTRREGQEKVSATIDPFAPISTENIEPSATISAQTQ